MGYYEDRRDEIAVERGADIVFFIIMVLIGIIIIIWDKILSI